MTNAFQSVAAARERPLIDRALLLHLGVLAALAVLGAILPAYHHGNLARIMVLATFALGYNIAFGYTGLLSLGHAMFFGAGVYGAGLATSALGLTAAPAFALGVLAAGALSLGVGALALRASGVAFMIVTLMFAQAAFLTALYFNEITRGDEGFVIASAARMFGGFDLATPDVRYTVAWVLFSVCLLAKLALVRSSVGRVFVAIRENEERARMLGYDTFRYKLIALVASAVFAGAAGAAYALLFGYVGATFASIEYSILPLLWVLLGGAGVVLGPLVGVAAMFYLIDITSGVTVAYKLIVGVALIGLVLTARAGVLGLIRSRFAPWLP